MAKFKEAHPYVLGALCSAVSCALRNIGGLRLGALPRMADFALWATAAAPSLGFEAAEFLSCYDNNRSAARRISLDASPVAETIKRAVGRLFWRGTASDLLTVVNEKSAETDRRSHGWPHTAKAMGEALRRLAPALRQTWGPISEQRTGGGRFWEIGPPSTAALGRCSTENASFASSVTQPVMPAPPVPMGLIGVGDASWDVAAAGNEVDIVVPEGPQ